MSTSGGQNIFEVKSLKKNGIFELKKSLGEIYRTEKDQIGYPMRGPPKCALPGVKKFGGSKNTDYQ